MRFAPTALGGLLALCTACSDSVPTPSPSPVNDGITASGPFSATFPAVPSADCALTGPALSFAITAQADTSTHLRVTLHDFHGAGVYTAFQGRAGTNGDVVEADHGTSIWVGDNGSITVVSTAYGSVSGQIDITMRPDTNAEGVVALTGHWACNITSESGTTPTPN